MLEMPLLFLILGLVIGATSAWLIATYKFNSERLTAEEISKKFISKEIQNNLIAQIDSLKAEIREKETIIIQSEKEIGAKSQSIIHLEDRLANQQNEFQSLQNQSHTSFENIANRLLTENGKKFTLQNHEKLSETLLPLKEKIKEFEQGIEQKFLAGTKDLISLKKEIEHLKELNQQLSTDANNLVSALKGDSKSQGDWGEFQLEMLLEKAGLTKNIHFRTQTSFKNEAGQARRPDFIINLPAQKHLVIDSKVSLVAYEKFFNSNSKDEKDAYLKEHLRSFRNHIRDLGSKNYQQLYQINSPDYLLLFVPIEPAFSVALQEDTRLFLEALEKNIVLVTTSTLLATMRTVSYIWKQEKQKKSVLEIARQSGLLFDKFVNFVEDLKAIGHKIDGAQGAYHDAMNKLVDSKKFGDTLIGRAQKIKDLGAKTSKSLPQELLDFREEDNEKLASS
jgi:DNA recombination protein RmuC